MKVVWSSQALHRLAESARFIACDDSDAAVRWVTEMVEVTDRLGTFPECGRLVPGCERRGVRELIHGHYRVFYRVDIDVFVMTIEHGSRLLEVEQLDEE